MRFALFLALTLALVSTSLAQFFCPPNYCSTFKCPELTEASCLARGPAGRFELHPHGGACGCCASCVKILHEGENCVEMMVQDRLPHEICAKDLQCDMANVRCVKKTIASGV